MFFYNFLIDFEFFREIVLMSYVVQNDILTFKCLHNKTLESNRFSQLSEMHVANNEHTNTNEVL